MKHEGFTQGEWRVGDSGKTVWSSSCGLVADCYEAVDQTEEGCKANARLMADAPSLLARAEKAEAEIERLNELVARYQCDPTGKLTTFEALRNHMEMAQRLCNDNYAWAKRVESEQEKLRSIVTDLDNALRLQLENECPNTHDYNAAYDARRRARKEMDSWQ